MKDIAEQVTQTVNERLAKRADRESDSKTPFIIAIDGRCCAGKTTLAAKLKEQNGWSVFHMDDFFLQPKQRTKERLAQPGGNVDYDKRRATQGDSCMSLPQVRQPSPQLLLPPQSPVCDSQTGEK